MVFMCLEKPLHTLLSSQKFPQYCLWNSAHGPLSSFQGRSSGDSSFHASLLQLSSVQDGICVSLRSFPNIAFETVPRFVWLTMAHSCPFKEDRPTLPLSTPLFSRWLMVWCPWLSACRLWPKLLLIFHHTSPLWWLLCLPVSLSLSLSIYIYLLGHFPLLWHVQGSTPRGVFRGGHWPSTHSSLQFAQQANFISSHGWQLWAVWKPRCPKNPTNITYINYPPALFTVRDCPSFKGTSLLKFVSKITPLIPWTGEVNMMCRNSFVIENVNLVLVV